MSQKTIAQGIAKHLSNNNKIDKCFAIGAEAIIYKIGDKIVKDRIPKHYRITELDNKIRKSRTKSEAKIINKLQNIIPVPKLLADSGSGRMIHMQFIDGDKLSNSLENLNYKLISKIIAENITKMHNYGIIHGDLTTSNMIYVKNINEKLNNKKEASIKEPPKHKNCDDTDNNRLGKVYFIDFGLAFHSQKIEDKAVDLHLLQQALEAKHFTIWQECIKIILDNYKPEKYKDIIQRIKVIESRGRYKDKY